MAIRLLIHEAEEEFFLKFVLLLDRPIDSSIIELSSHTNYQFKARRPQRMEAEMASTREFQHPLMILNLAYFQALPRSVSA